MFEESKGRLDENKELGVLPGEWGWFPRWNV